MACKVGKGKRTRTKGEPRLAAAHPRRPGPKGRNGRERNRMVQRRRNPSVSGPHQTHNSQEAAGSVLPGVRLWRASLHLFRSRLIQSCRPCWKHVSDMTPPLGRHISDGRRLAPGQNSREFCEGLLRTSASVGLATKGRAAPAALERQRSKSAFKRAPFTWRSRERNRIAQRRRNLAGHSFSEL